MVASFDIDSDDLGSHVIVACLYRHRNSYNFQPSTAMDPWCNSYPLYSVDLAGLDSCLDRHNIALVLEPIGRLS